MKFLVTLFCAIALASYCQSAKVRYDHYHVYKVNFSTEEQFNYLYQMRLQSTEVNFWQISHSQHYAEIMVAPEKSEAFLNDLQAHGLTFKVEIEDVQKLINTEHN